MRRARRRRRYRGNNSRALCVDAEMQTDTFYPTHPTGYRPRSRLYFDGKSETYPNWEIRFINSLYTLDKGVHKAILQLVTGVDYDDDFDAKNKRAYAELVQVLDEWSLQLIMRDAPDDGR